MSVRGQLLRPADRGVEQQEAVPIGIIRYRRSWAEVSDQCRQDLVVLSSRFHRGVSADQPDEVAESLRPRPEPRRTLTVPTGAPPHENGVSAAQRALPFMHGPESAPAVYSQVCRRGV